MNSFLMFVVPGLLFASLLLPFAWLFAGGRARVALRSKAAVGVNLVMFFGVLLMFILGSARGAFAQGMSELDMIKAMPAVATMTTGAGLAYLGAAISTGFSSLGAGIAVAAAAPAAIGACSEDPKAMGKSLVFIALGEGVALYGLIVSVLIIGNLS